MPEGALNQQNNEIYLLVRTRSILACLIHWVLFGSVVTLVVTGFYIAYPRFYFGQGEAYQAFAMADIRYYHFVAATVMMTSLLIRFYLAFTDSCNKDMKQFFPTPRNIINAVKLAVYFVTGNGEHKHYRFVNPLGGIGIFMMSVSFLFMALTGFLMYLPASNPNTIWYSLSFSLTASLGGLQQVRLFHHGLMFVIIALVTIHVYMQIWKNVMFTESDISSIIAGYKLFPEKEIGHFDDYYGIRLREKLPSEKEMEKASSPADAS